MKKIGSISSILMIVLMILSCANSTPGVPRADATVMIKNASPVTSREINDQAYNNLQILNQSYLNLLDSYIKFCESYKKS